MAVEISNASDKQQQTLLENYHKLLTKLQTPECATLVQGMRRFVRNIPKTEEEMTLALRSYLTSTFESMKSHAAWRGVSVDDGLKHALESFLYGQCRQAVQNVLKDELAQDEEFLERLSSLQFVSPAHLEVACLVDANPDELLKESIETLSSVDSYFSPYEKLQLILKVYHCVNTALSKTLNKDGGTSERLPSADDVLPTLILTILRSKPTRIVSNLRMIEIFCPPEYLRGEAGYAYTNLYGAFQFLRDMNIDHPENLSIHPDDFCRGLEESLASAKTHLAKVTADKLEESNKKEVITFPIEIPVREVRAARLRGDSVDLEWAKQWQAEHGVEGYDTTLSNIRPEGADVLPDSLPSGFSRSYSYMVTRPEDIRVTDLPQLLAEYRMLVHTTEQLLGERTARLAAERKQKVFATQAALRARAAEVDLSKKREKTM